MFRKSIYLFFILLISSSFSFALSDLCYVEFNTSNMDQLESEIIRFELSGAEVVHIFPPDAVFARIANPEYVNIVSNSEIRAFIPPPRKNAHFKKSH